MCFGRIINEVVVAEYPIEFLIYEYLHDEDYISVCRECFSPVCMMHRINQNICEITEQNVYSGIVIDIGDIFSRSISVSSTTETWKTTVNCEGCLTQLTFTEEELNTELKQHQSDCHLDIAYRSALINEEKIWHGPTRIFRENYTL